MKICPECALTNEERFPACVRCNALLVGVRSTPAADPNHPEHAQRLLHRQRGRRQRWQLLFVLVSYVATMVFLAFVPGMYFDRGTLAVFAGGACVVGLGIVSEGLGPLSAMLAQGVVSAVLVLYFGGFGPLTAFMLLGHVVLPAVFAHWVDLLDSSYR